MKVKTKLSKTFVCIIVAIIALSAVVSVIKYSHSDAPVDAQKCRLSFAAVSDVHFDAYDENALFAFGSEITARAILPFFEKMDERLDAVVFAGDITEHGYESQWVKTQEVLTSYDLADNIIIAAGNHDTWTRDKGDKTFRELFTEYASEIMGEEAQDIYFTREINGYTFIILCSEGDSTSGDFSDTQINWLRAELAKAAEKDLPIFVICHWPINETHGLPEIWGSEDYDENTGGIGPQSADIEKALKEYDNVFLISGHIHAGLSNAEEASENGYQSLESDGSFHSLNLPRLNAFNSVGNFMIGTGYNIEVYDNEVVFRARNYLTGNWLPEYDYTIPLV